MEDMDQNLVSDLEGHKQNIKWEWLLDNKVQDPTNHRITGWRFPMLPLPQPQGGRIIAVPSLLGMPTLSAIVPYLLCQFL